MRRRLRLRFALAKRRHGGIPLAAVLALAAVLGPAAAWAQEEGAPADPPAARVADEDPAAAEAAAAAKAAEALRQAEARADAVIARKGAYEPWNGRLARGDAVSRFVAYRERGAVVLIEEERDRFEYGSGTVVYVFDHGALRFVRLAETRTRTEPGASGSDEVRLRVAYDAEGTVLGTAKTVNGEPVGMTGNEARSFLAVAADLAARAGDTPADATSPVAHPVKRVQFRGGGYATTLTGSLAPHETQDYLLSGSRDKTLRVSLDSSIDAVGVLVITPNGDVLFDGTRGGRRSWSGPLNRAGDFRVRVLVDREADLAADAACGYTLRLSLR